MAVTAFVAIFPAITALAAISFAVTALACNFGVLIAPLAIAVSVICDAATMIFPPLMVNRSLDAGRYFRRSSVPAALPMLKVFCGVPATSVFVRPFTSNDTSLAVTVVAASGFGMTTAIGEGVAEVEARRVAPL